MKSDAEMASSFFLCHRWACAVPSLFFFSPSFPENTDIILLPLPVILGCVCSDFSTCNYYNNHRVLEGTGEIVSGPTGLTEKYSQ